MGCVKQSKERQIPIPSCPVEYLRPLSPTFSLNLRFRYTLHRIIGRGHYGVVHLASLKADSKETFAIKAISKKKIRAAKVMAEREIGMLRQLDHPNVIRLIEVYEDFRYIYLVMEYCAGGDLCDRIDFVGRHKEKDAAEIMWKILLAVRHLHSKKICHRDLKPANFMFTTRSSHTSELKLIDFGLSHKFTHHSPSSTELKSMVGTPAYLPPEILTGKYGPKCDMWSAGVILHVLLSGEMPFLGGNVNETYDRIASGQFSLEGKEWEDVSERAKDLIAHLLVLDPIKRLGVDEAMSHPWFKSYIHREMDVDFEVVKALHSLKPRTILQAETFALIVKRLRDDRLIPLKQTFAAMDSECTGYVTPATLSAGFASIGLKLAMRDLEEIVRNASRRRDGKISFSEFLAAAIESHALLTYETIQLAFRVYDVENTGRLTEENIAEALTRSGRCLDEKTFKKMLSEVNISASGLSFEDFRQLLKQ